ARAASPGAIVLPRIARIHSGSARPVELGHVADALPRFSGPAQLIPRAIGARVSIVPPLRPASGTMASRLMERGSAGIEEPPVVGIPSSGSVPTVVLVEIRSVGVLVLIPPRRTALLRSVCISIATIVESSRLAAPCPRRRCGLARGLSRPGGRRPCRGRVAVLGRHVRALPFETVRDAGAVRLPRSAVDLLPRVPLR